jgi:hypothetical protein
MSFAKPPRKRGCDGRAGVVRFVKVEVPVAAGPLVIETNGGCRFLLSEPGHVALLVQLLDSVSEGGAP